MSVTWHLLEQHMENGSLVLRRTHALFTLVEVFGAGHACPPSLPKSSMIGGRAPIDLSQKPQMPQLRGNVAMPAPLLILSRGTAQRWVLQLGPHASGLETGDRF